MSADMQRSREESGALPPIDAEVTRHSLLALQVCVPKTWTDEEVLAFAEKEVPCGTEGGWFLRKQGSERLSGCDERVQCSQHPHRCHIMFDA